MMSFWCLKLGTAVLVFMVVATSSAQDAETTTKVPDDDEDPNNPCKSNPCGNGICKLDLENSTRDYHCYCEDGFTGDHCQTDWDECWSNPCQNGATCVDQIADFNCTCPSGFSGKVCEINVNECLSDPCHNNGTCVDSINGYHCDCLRGFSGLNCDIDITVCNSTEKKCSNGGQCIEGLGEAFFCYCPIGWHGETCEDDVDECLESPCENGGMCMNLEGDFVCTCPFGFAGERCNIVLEQCETNPCQNEALCFVVDDNYQCYCVPDFHGHHCQYKYNDCLLPPFPKCLNDGKCKDGVDSFTCTCKEGFTGDYCECSSATNECIDINSTLTWTLPPNLEELWDNATALSTDPDSITELPLIKPEIEPSMISPTSTHHLVPTSIIVYNVTGSDEIEASPVTSLYIYEFSSSELVTRSFLADEGFVIMTSPTYQSEIVATKTTMEGKTAATTQESVTDSSKEESETGLPSTEKTQSLESISTTPSITTTITEHSDGDEHTMTPIEVFTKSGYIPEHESETTTSMMMSLGEDSTEKSLADDTLKSTSPATRGPSSVTGKTSSVTDLAILGGYEPDFDEKACESNVCRNGGTCLSTLTGPKCHCPLQFSGRQCEEEVQVDMPGFVGHSLLVHQLDNTTKGFNLMLTFRTSTPNGLLFYSGAKEEFMVAAYIQSGILKFKVNCGSQVILFTDPRNRVDSGYQQSIRVTLDLDQPDKCLTVIQLNETHTMKGEQEISVLPKQPDLIYFGLMPHKRDPEVELINNGFQGCMQHLQLNNVEVHLYRDAISGRDIVECQSAVCAIKPCRNGAMCTQHEESGSWFCNCPPGFTGSLCERPVCNTNPCRFGGTCLGSNAGPGFLCLCPFGRGGALCQDDLQITQPSFTSSVGGYSSYLAYPIVPAELSNELEGQFHFTTSITDQVALLFFLGQEGFHEFGSDYVAISYVKGHILFTWDLGAGPRRIFTTRPVDERYMVHSVQFGRKGRAGWLQVDHFANITGRAPGLRENLNISSSYLFVGGHENHNFTLLPHDLPVHRGFQGCIFDIAMRSPLGQLSPLSHTSVEGSSSKGRNIHQCYTDVCSSNPCSNGGTCIPYGASFICECPDGKFGVTCSEESSACTTGRHMCAEGSKCSVVKDGAYECLCPLGKSGEHCTEDISISDPLFSGDHSYMSLTLNSAVRFNTDLSLEIRPDSLDGLIVHFGQSRDARHRDFFSVMLRNATLVFSFSLGGPRGGQSNSLTLSLCCVTQGMWHTIEAGRSGREGYLKLDSQVAKGTAPPGLSTLDVDHTIYLGGTGPEDAFYQDPEITDPHFSGCMRNLNLNGLFYPLSVSRGWTGWAIEDCDGTACGGEVCQNDGVCTLEPGRTGGFACQCPKEFQGRNCELHTLCEDDGGCQNGATCSVEKSEVICDCEVGFVGEKCEKQADLDVPMFSGESFLSIPIPETKTLRHVTTFAFEVKTNSSDGMILWIGEDLSSDDYLGIGLRNGMIHLVWNLGWFSRTELTIPSPEIKVNDGSWHSIKVNRVRQNLDVEVDGEIYNSRVTGSYYELNTANNVLLGGTNGHGNILDVTRGHFKSGFAGCIQKLNVQSSDINASEPGVHGKNVKSCTMEK